MTREELDQHRHDLAEEIRQYCRDQVNAWRQVPWFFLQSQGRTGWGDGHQYVHGLQPIRSLDAHGYIGGFVDLETGELVINPEKLLPMPDDRVLQIKLDEIDAPEILAGYVRISYEPTGSYYDFAEQEAHRQKLATVHGLAAGEPYTRKHPNVVHEDYMG